MGHEKKELEFFCKICKVAICNTCVLTDHDGHAKIALASAANERKLRVKAAIESQKRRAETKMDEITRLDGNCINQVLIPRLQIRYETLCFASVLLAWELDAFLYTTDTSECSSVVN